ncbi:putative dehydrogenase [Dyadobacter jejuensis]|uniref:Putative dehydrogenase n=1 Tax=Dyadobacter jejuensis TaxID=1082580 RepID=A0A316AGU8_9BACT|nr:Gfo/Idh/MocA family oxidoreductase [Dyadobacter jejuensis]PWJ56862.1 putative dehydrogenase [Dyadobacter jejuensis]
MNKLKGVVIGAGYFSDFHYDAWSRIDEVEIVALADFNEENGQAMQGKYGISTFYNDYQEMLEKEKPDFVDIVTPPASHLSIVEHIVTLGIPMICQKPLAPSDADAKRMVSLTQEAGIPFMVHENFRFQPWHREIKRLISEGVIGDIHNLSFNSRMGDGWGEDAYLSRQPYFRAYEHLLIYETGIHFIDLIRFYAGEIRQGFVKTRRLNPVIKGEDRVHAQFETHQGVWAFWDANRYNEPITKKLRYTFCELTVEGRGGSIRLDYEGNITIQKLGEEVTVHSYIHGNRGFAGDSCLATQQHFVSCLLNGGPFETNGLDYLKNIEVQRLAYRSADEGLPFLIRL